MQAHYLLFYDFATFLQGSSTLKRLKNIDFCEAYSKEAVELRGNMKSLRWKLVKV